jgi:hypothetical protein
MNQNEPRMSGDWLAAANQSIAQNLIDSLVKLLGGKVSYISCSDKTKGHEKIVIEYNHFKK